MNLSEEKKEPLRQQPTNNKKKMLIMHYKGKSNVYIYKINNFLIFYLYIYLLFFSLSLHLG